MRPAQPKDADNVRLLQSGKFNQALRVLWLITRKSLRED